jgi:molecular chaperone HscC
MIGIDLGTTNSLVAVIDEGQPRVIANELGETLTPSVVAVAEDGELLVGRAAKDRLVTAPGSGVAHFKRDMGSDVRYRFGGRLWSPVECSGVVLKEMKRVAEHFLGREVTEAVVTVPAYFRDEQRQATLAAAEIAGLKIGRILNEPTAAALAYGYLNPGEEKHLLVFDLGGGTFDVTLLEVFDGVIEVKASAGESHLGGEDYTDALCGRLIARASLAAGGEGRLRVREIAEDVKRRLSRDETVTVAVGGAELEVTRREFEEAAAAITARIRPVVSRCLRDGGKSASQLDDVLLVGGASRMPLVISLIEQTFNRIPNRRLDPDRVVAQGAGVQVALYIGDAAVGDVVLTDVCPHTLGVEVCKEVMLARHEEGYFAPILDRNTTVPTSRSSLFSTMHPEQDEVHLKVYQGEGRLVKDNRRIGEVRVRGLRAREGQRMPGTVEVRFSYDMNGILEVEATVISTGKKTSKVIEQRPGTLSPEEIRAAVARLAPLKTHPRDKLLNRARIERANRVYTELTGPARERLAYLVEEFEEALASVNSSAPTPRSSSNTDRTKTPPVSHASTRPTSKQSSTWRWASRVLTPRSARSGLTVHPQAPTLATTALSPPPPGGPGS